jgi:ubiquinone biosynthesis UbiH/UbiF/VisC/COQ6 family hydroxylase
VARLIAGSDGGRSWLRSTMGWPAHVRDYAQQGVVVNFRCERPHLEVARQWFIDGEVIALLPLAGQHVALVWSAYEERVKNLLAGTPERRAETLRDQIGAPLGGLDEISAVRAFPLRLTRVPQVSGDRVVLLGDAAHGVHPLAGQGLNLGLADAACLADVLARRGGGPDIGDRSVLRRYARRRAGPVQTMQWTCDGLHRLFASPSPPLGRLRNIGLDLVDRAPLLKTLLAAAASGSTGMPD